MAENSNGNPCKYENDEKAKQQGKRDATGIKDGAEIKHENEGTPGGY